MASLAPEASLALGKTHVGHCATLMLQLLLLLSEIYFNSPSDTLSSAAQTLFKAERGCVAICHTLHGNQGKSHTLQKLGEQRVSQSVILAVDPLNTHYTQLLCSCRNVLITI